MIFIHVTQSIHIYEPIPRSALPSGSLPPSHHPHHFLQYPTATHTSFSLKSQQFFTHTQSLPAVNTWMQSTYTPVPPHTSVYPHVCAFTHPFTCTHLPISHLHLHSCLSTLLHTCLVVQGILHICQSAHLLYTVPPFYTTVHSTGTFLLCLKRLLITLGCKIIGTQVVIRVPKRF